MSLFEPEPDPVKVRVKGIFLDGFERAYGPFRFPDDSEEEEDDTDGPR